MNNNSLAIASCHEVTDSENKVSWLWWERNILSWCWDWHQLKASVKSKQEIFSADFSCNMHITQIAEGKCLRIWVRLLSWGHIYLLGTVNREQLIFSIYVMSENVAWGVLRFCVEKEFSENGCLICTLN